MTALPSIVVIAAVFGAAEAPRPPTPESRALAYLAREVPRWSRENKCYSCHNNGDAARALYAAVRLGYRVPGRALADTSRWLARPAGWKHNGGEGEFNDKRLATLQFAATLAEALDAGLVTDREALPRAAREVARLQQEDGSWQTGARGTIGSPATHGAALATALARRTLRRADPRKYAPAVARADAWLLKLRVGTVLDAAAVLLALGKADDDAAVAQRRRCLALVRKGESREGGWGPYVNSGPEAFDTAVVLLALGRQADTAENRAMIRRGRKYLASTQEKDGSWPETTRPPGAESYAQRLSTAGWATLALLLTREGGPPARRAATSRPVPAPSP